MTMTLIATATVVGSPAAISFSSIPQEFTDLLLVGSVRTSHTGDDALGLTINASSSGNIRRLRGDGSSASSTSFTTMFIGGTNGSFTANTFNSNQLYFPNYSGSTNKSFSVEHVLENNATAGDLQIQAGLFSSTAAITALSFFNASSGLGFAVGSTASLYGITKGSDGIVTTS